MRSEKEVGGFKDFGDKANEAYRTYASLYLDFVDDNMNHFLWRDHDINPIENIPLEERNEESITDAYMKKAIEIAKTVISSGYYNNLGQMLNDYPSLKQYEDELESEFCNEKDEM